MTSESRIILPIKPHTWVKIKSGPHGDQVLFRIPEICYKGRGGGQCSVFKRSLRNKKVDGVIKEVGFCKHTLSKTGRDRKRRIEKYNKYRVDLFHLAKEAGFMLPTSGMAVYFYIPTPKRWSKTKKIAMHGQHHNYTPDLSNLVKAWEDSLSVMDEQIGQYTGLGKFWVNQEEGYIEILINQSKYNPFNVEFIDKGKTISMSDLMERRQKRMEKRKLAREEGKKKKKQPKKQVTQKHLFRKKDGIK